MVLMIRRSGMNLKKIAENHGLATEGVDYALTQYQIVICEITHGMMSKLSYDAHDIIRMAQERWCDTCNLKKQEAVKPEIHNSTADVWYYICGECETPIGPGDCYCSYCGKAVKWGA